MSEINVHGKRFYPEPSVSFPRLHKPPSPIHYQLPPLMPSPPPAPIRPLTAPPMFNKPANPATGASETQNHINGVPLPGVPKLANYMINNRVPFETISGDIGPQGTEIGVAKCRSSKELIEVAKKFTSSSSISQISKLLDLRDEMFHNGGAFVFTPEQFVQFYSIYNMFLTEERSWDPRLSEKFFQSSRTRLRCSCRWSPRLNKKPRKDGSDCKNCSAVYDMSYWPLHRLVIWECLVVPNHSMEVNASISTCQYVDSVVLSMCSFSAQDIEVMIKARLAPLVDRLHIKYLDLDRVRSLLRNVEETYRMAREPQIGPDLIMASHLTELYASPDVFSRYISFGNTHALIILHKDVFRTVFNCESLTFSTNYKVSLHYDNISLLTITTEDGRHGVSLFIPMDETSTHFSELLLLCMEEIEKLGYELYGNGNFAANFVGLANVNTINVSLASQKRIPRLESQLSTIKENWASALNNYKCLIGKAGRFLSAISDTDVLSLVLNAYSAETVAQGEQCLLSAIRLSEERRNGQLENHLRTQFQLYHKWGPLQNRWTVNIDSQAATCFDQVKSLPFSFRFSIAASALQFSAWLAQAHNAIRPRASPVRIGISSVLCTPPASDDERLSSK